MERLEGILVEHQGEGIPEVGLQAGGNQQADPEEGIQREERLAEGIL